MANFITESVTLASSYTTWWDSPTQLPPRRGTSSTTRQISVAASGQFCRPHTGRTGHFEIGSS
jgi:hypothetical protein